jgi:hypothetical protein
VIVFALKNLLEAGNGLFEGDQLAGVTGENLGNLQQVL